MEQTNIYDHIEPKRKMRVLVACEESQAVCIAFRERGHEAYSCDLSPTSGGHPEWHIQDDVLKHLDDGWDLMIAFPPCTNLCNTGQRWFVEGWKNPELKETSAKFFMEFVNANIPLIAIENPVGIMSTRYRKADQIINPYEFGHPEQKRTCLWLKGLPLLTPTNIIAKELRTTNIHKSHFDGKAVAWGSDECRRLRSKTFFGIAKSMADQWG